MHYIYPFAYPMAIKDGKGEKSKFIFAFIPLLIIYDTPPYRYLHVLCGYDKTRKEPNP